MKILITGDRNWNDMVTMKNELLKYKNNNPIIIHGGCRGADAQSQKLAEIFNIKSVCYPADWSNYGKKAGVLRNQQMIDEEKPDLVLAFHNDIENSRGTKDMVKRAEKEGIDIKIIKSFYQ